MENLEVLYASRGLEVNLKDFWLNRKNLVTKYINMKTNHNIFRLRPNISESTTKFLLNQKNLEAHYKHFSSKNKGQHEVFYLITKDLK